MKFCWWTLFEAGRALIYLSRIEQYIRGNQAGFDVNSRTLTHFIACKEHIADKGLAKPSRRVLLQVLYSLQFSAFYEENNFDSATEHF